MKVIVSVCASVGCGEDTGKRLSRERILFFEWSKNDYDHNYFVKMGRAICLGGSQLRVNAVFLAAHTSNRKVSLGLMGSLALCHLVPRR